MGGVCKWDWTGELGDGSRGGGEAEGGWSGGGSGEEEEEDALWESVAMAGGEKDG